MSQYLTLCYAKSGVDILIAAAIVALALFVPFVFHIHLLLQQWRCRHDEFWENEHGKAVCSKCSKNLGFIDQVQYERNKEKK